MNLIFEEIRAADLTNWADRVESDRQLASLVRHLVLGSGAKVRGCRFLTHEETNTSGWDGIVIAETEGLYVPAQNSGWELSKEKAVVAKAERDISERSANPGELQLPETTTLRSRFGDGQAGRSMTASKALAIIRRRGLKKRKRNTAGKTSA